MEINSIKNKYDIEDKGSLLTPLVSVIVPSYNHEKYITQCIESIINQSYKNIELIVIDDGSTDTSVEILNNLSRKYNFRFIVQKNIGLSATLNKGIIEFSTGKYITFCASDDFWAKEKLEKQVDFLEENSNYPMCFSSCYYVDKMSQILDYEFLYKTEKQFKSGLLFEDLLLLKYHLPVSYMFTKEILMEVNYFPTNMICEDFYMNLKISEKYPIGYIDERLIYYRFQLNSNSRTKQIIDSQKEIIDTYEKHRSYPQALFNWKLRALNAFSSHSSLKKKTISFLSDFELMSSAVYWKSILKLFLK